VRACRRPPCQCPASAALPALAPSCRAATLPPSCHVPTGAARLGQRGTNGAAWLLESKRTADKVVSKEVSLSLLSANDLAAVENEVRILASLSHPNIVAYLASFPLKAQQLLCVVMEYAEGGTLAQVIETHRLRREALASMHVVRWVGELGSALEHLHRSRVLHRDLKAANVFLSLDQQVKLGDFGVSRAMSHQTQLLQTVVGTPYYMSPEVMRSSPYAEPADLWAVGVLLYQLLTLMLPFEADNLAALVLAVTSRGADTAPLEASPHPAELCALATNEALLHPDPQARMTLPALLAALAHVGGSLSEKNALPHTASYSPGTRSGFEAVQLSGRDEHSPTGSTAAPCRAAHTPTPRHASQPIVQPPRALPAAPPPAQPPQKNSFVNCAATRTPFGTRRHLARCTLAPPPRATIRTRARARRAH